MHQAVKEARPILPPAIWLGLEYAAIELEWLNGDSILTAMLAAAGIMWLLWAAMKAIGRKWPGLEPWLIVGQRLSPPTELIGSHIEGKTFRIADLAVNNKIYEKTFVNCVIIGPAVLAGVGYNARVDCIYTAKPDDTCWLLDKNRACPIGATVTDGCTFKRCRFIGIGFAESAKELEDTKKELEQAGSSRN
ncbi:MAG: hypothetical protein IH984_14920 [Planctomycetes bacterium]|nr:hypothetical protein [Planctomycetota bacterium]